MTWDNFYQSVIKNIEKRPSPKAIWLKPSLDRIPLPIQRFDEPFLPLSKAIVKATKDNIAIYIFDLASYISIGAAGIVALERAIAYTNQEAVTVLHGPFSGTNYGILGEDISLNVDALTVTSHEDLNYYTTNPPYGAFLFNGAHVEKGGTMNTNTLTLYNPEQADIIIELIDTDMILQDLTETYVDTIKASVV